MYRTHRAADLGPEMDGEDVVIGGWIEDIRNLGGIAFLVLRDGSGRVQVTLIKKMLGTEIFKEITALNRESVILVSGRVQRNEKAGMGFEVVPSNISILSRADAPLPLGIIDDVGAEMETRLDNRILDLRKDDMEALFIIKSHVVGAVRDFLRHRGFIEVHTPKIVASATEGGTALFEVKYFDNKAFLNQSPQLYKQMLMATGLDRVFETGPAFRAEEHATVRHLNEFISIDIEMSFADEEVVMDLLEDMIKHVLVVINDECRKELKALNIAMEVPSYRFPRLTYDRVLELAGEAGYEVAWGEDIGLEALKAAIDAQEDLQGYYFITRWPTETKPFYALPYDDNPKVCRAFDLMYRAKEITSGAQRVHDYDMLRERIVECGLNPESFEYYLRAFRYGMPPHAGWGLGLERLIMVILGLDNIRSATLFPRDKKRLVP